MPIAIGPRHNNEYKFFSGGTSREIRAETREGAIRKYATWLGMDYAGVIAEMLAGQIFATERLYRSSTGQVVKSAHVAASYLARFFIERDREEITNGHAHGVKKRHGLNSQLPDDLHVLQAALYERLKTKPKSQIRAIFHKTIDEQLLPGRDGMEQEVAYEMATRAANIGHGEIPYYLAEAGTRTAKMPDALLKKHFRHIQNKRTRRHHGVAA